MYVQQIKVFELFQHHESTHYTRTCCTIGLLASEQVFLLRLADYFSTCIISVITKEISFKLQEILNNR